MVVRGMTGVSGLPSSLLLWVSGPTTRRDPRVDLRPYTSWDLSSIPTLPRGYVPALVSDTERRGLTGGDFWSFGLTSRLEESLVSSTECRPLHHGCSALRIRRYVRFPEPFPESDPRWSDTCPSPRVPLYHGSRSYSPFLRTTNSPSESLVFLDEV